MNYLLPILILPFTVTIILSASKSIAIGWGLGAPLNFLPPIVGAGVIALGLVLMVKTTLMFATIGKGTLAPWDPPQRLVVRGVYRHVRNPMISGVIFVLFGEAILFGAIPLFVWFGAFALANIVYIPCIEERDLERRFGEGYLQYKQNVPRWIPRVKPLDLPQRQGHALCVPNQGDHKDRPYNIFVIPGIVLYHRKR